MPGAEIPVEFLPGQYFFYHIKQLSSAHPHSDLLQPCDICGKVGLRHTLHIIGTGRGQLGFVPDGVARPAGGAAGISHGQGNGITRLHPVLGGEHICVDKSGAACGDGHYVCVLTVPDKGIPELQLRDTLVKHVQSIQHTIRGQGGAVFIVCDLIGVVGGPGSVPADKQRCGIAKKKIRFRNLFLHDFPDRIHDIGWEIIGMEAVLRPACKKLPAHKSRPSAGHKPGIQKQFLHCAVRVLRLVRKGEYGGVDRLREDPRFSAFIQIFIAKNHPGAAVLLKDQQRLLKAWEKAGEIHKVGAVLHIRIDDQLFDSIPPHSDKNFFPALPHGLVTQHYGKGAVLLRCIYFPVYDIHFVLSSF